MRTRRDRRAIVARCAGALRRPRLHAVRGVEGGRARTARVVGYMPIYVPREIIHAAGMLPLGILGGGDDLEIIHGDAYYQCYICHIPRSTLELGRDRAARLRRRRCSSRRSATSSATSRACGRCCFPTSYVRYFDVPQNFDAASAALLRAASSQTLRAISTTLGAARTITDERCAPRSRVYNENRRLVASSYALRRPSALARARPRRSTSAARRAWCCRSRSTRRSCATTSPRRAASRGRGATTRASC